MSTIQESVASQCVAIRLVSVGSDGSQPDCKLSHAVSVLGSGDWCDVILESDDVAAAHAAIVKYGGSGYLCDLGARGGAALNGRLVRWARLTTGDTIRVGPFDFKIEIEGEAPNLTVNPPVFALRGDEETGLVTSIDPVLLIGRDGGCDVVLSETGVQPRHCLVAWTDRGPIVRDLTGDRSTFVNGLPVMSALLLDGNTLGVGSHELIFEIENAPTFEQKMSGRFSENAPDCTGEGLVPELVAGRYGECMTDSDDDVAVAPSAATTAITGGHTPNYFSQIISAAEADLTELSEMEAAADAEEARERDERSMESADSACATPASESTQGLSPEAILKKAEQLQHKTAEMRRRVAEAQRALDSRAQKHREDILRERQRLREKRALLQMQAKALIEAAKAGRANAGESTDSQSVVLKGEAAEGSVLEIHEEPAQKAFVEYVANEATVRKLISGGADLIECSDFNTKETERILNDPRGATDDDSLKSLDERVAELIRVAQAERKEIERGEALVETLRFETSRQRRTLTKRQEKLRARELSLEERFRALAKARENVRRERAPLLARLKTLDADEAAIRERLEESEKLHLELTRESEALDQLSEGLETRERALLHKLELERQRLLIRQTQLKRKAAQLAKAARERRMAIEKEVLRQQAELEAREAELRARRFEIEEMARGELEKTAGDLEQVLGVRLSEIETELESRRIDLDQKVQELAGLNHAHVRAAREAADPIDAPLRRIASEFANGGRFDDPESTAASASFDHLADEIDAFSRAQVALRLAPEIDDASTDDGDECCGVESEADGSDVTHSAADEKEEKSKSADRPGPAAE